MPVVMTNHPPPNDDVVFQEMCVDLYRVERPDEVVEIYGRNGQSQHGVDIIVRDGNGRLNCLQCKCREEVTISDLRQDLEKTKKFPHKIWRYTFLVSVKIDKKLQDEIIRLLDQYDFQIAIRFWPELAGAIASFETLAKRYFTYVVTRVIEVDTSPTAVHLILKVDCSRYSFLVVRMSGFAAYAGDKNLVLLTGLVAEKKSGFHRLGGGHWTDIFKSAVPFKVDSYIVWKWLSQFKTFDELMMCDGERSIEGLTESELSEVYQEFSDDDDD